MWSAAGLETTITTTTTTIFAYHLAPSSFFFHDKLVFSVAVSTTDRQASRLAVLILQAENLKDAGEVIGTLHAKN